MTNDVLFGKYNERMVPCITCKIVVLALLHVSLCCNAKGESAPNRPFSSQSLTLQASLSVSDSSILLMEIDVHFQPISKFTLLVNETLLLQMSVGNRKNE